MGKGETCLGAEVGEDGSYSSGTRTIVSPEGASRRVKRGLRRRSSQDPVEPGVCDEP